MKGGAKNYCAGPPHRHRAVGPNTHAEDCVMGTEKRPCKCRRRGAGVQHATVCAGNVSGTCGVSQRQHIFSRECLGQHTGLTCQEFLASWPQRQMLSVSARCAPNGCRALSLLWQANSHHGLEHHTRCPPQRDEMGSNTMGGSARIAQRRMPVSTPRLSHDRWLGAYSMARRAVQDEWCGWTPGKSTHPTGHACE